jgi:outer membrane protein
MNTSYRTALIICAVLYSSSAQSDLLLGINAAASTWFSNQSGDIGKTPQSFNALGFGSNVYSSFYLDIELAGLPEIQFSYTEISASANGTTAGSFDLGGNSFPASTDIDIGFDVETADLTLYWQLSDNIVGADLGLTGRYIDGRVRVNDGLTTDSVELHSIVPLAFMRARFDLPYSGWYLEGDTHLIKYEGNGYSDSAVKLGWQTESITDFGLNVGYREMSLKVEELDGLSADLKISGPFASATFHF